MQEERDRVAQILFVEADHLKLGEYELGQRETDRLAPHDGAARDLEWTRGSCAAMQPFIGSGVYANFFAADDGRIG